MVDWHLHHLFSHLDSSILNAAERTCSGILAYITTHNISQGKSSTHLADDKQTEHHKVLDDSLRGLSVISLSQGGIQNNYAV